MPPASIPAPAALGADHVPDGLAPVAPMSNGAAIAFTGPSPTSASPDGASHANGHAPHLNGHAGDPHGHAPEPPAGCTAPQLRRFIKSRPYVPMHELRRRFGIDGGEDDVTAVDLASGRIFVGLPPREGGLLGELLRSGDIGYELSLDPRSPIVVGLYPMRPIARA